MSTRAKRGLIFIGLVLLPFIIGLLFTFEIVKIWFPTNMENQPWINYQESPRIYPPEKSIPIQGVTILLDASVTNPIPADEISVERGRILYQVHCALCHGDKGVGNGPLAEYFTIRPPTDLTAPYIASLFDSSLFRTISYGMGQMPPLGENLTTRERWDVINFLRNLETIQ